MLITQLSQARIRVLVVTGFVLGAVGAVISYINEVTSIGAQLTSFRYDVDTLVNPLATIAAVVAWSWLVQLDARDERQCTILRRAFLCLALEYLLFAVGFNFIFTPIHSIGGFWTTLDLWLEFLGSVLVALGLFLYSRSLFVSSGRSDIAAADD